MGFTQYMPVTTNASDMRTVSAIVELSAQPVLFLIRQFSATVAVMQMPASRSETMMAM